MFHLSVGLNPIHIHFTIVLTLTLLGLCYKILDPLLVCVGIVKPNISSIGLYNIGFTLLTLAVKLLCNEMIVFRIHKLLRLHVEIRVCRKFNNTGNGNGPRMAPEVVTSGV